jgi:hypothetical protein
MFTVALILGIISGSLWLIAVGFLIWGLYHDDLF